jgi:hypothetical protein
MVPCGSRAVFVEVKSPCKFSRIIKERRSVITKRKIVLTLI